MTKEITLHSGRYLLVKNEIELPKPGEYKNANPPYKFRLWENKLQAVPLDVEEFDPSPYELYEICDLPEDHTYTLIGKADQLTEDQWKGIVGHVAGSFEIPSWKGLSLIKGHGFEIDTTLILKID